MVERGQFGTIVYFEAEYHHGGPLSLMDDDRSLPAWRRGFPRMLCANRSTGMILPVTSERLAELQVIGWADDYAVCGANRYDKSSWNTIGAFRTSSGQA